VWCRATGDGVLNAVHQTHLAPDGVLNSVVELADPSTITIHIAVAYVTFGGVDLLVQRLRKRCGSDGWSKSSKCLVTCFDYGITDPKALVEWNKLPNASVRIHVGNLLTTAQLTPVRPFHPKVYIVSGPKRCGVVVGSANLTERGLTTNVEVVSVMPDAKEGEVGALWDGLVSASVALTPDVLAMYQKLREATVIPPVDPPVVITTPAGTAGTLWDAISDGTVKPMGFARFWVEGGSMSSGGSKNQLEIPRGGNRFFGYTFKNYDNNHHVIGQPPLISGPNSWTDRRLTWHGNNKMERLNLPTASQGGFDYPQTAVLFRRVSGGYELQVADWQSGVARGWRNASSAIGQTYKLGENSPRTCGFLP
jgi:HKD family nuclease